MTHRRVTLGLFTAFLAIAALSAQQSGLPPADMLLVNGRIVTADAQGSTHAALAIRGDRITGIGTVEEVRRLAGPSTRTIDLQGRTVIPGLIDSHMHAIRAALSFSTEVHWIGARSIAEALQRLREGAARRPAGSWLIVAGGWTERQFAERRRPTQAEVTAAAPNHRIYIQLGYQWVLLNPAGLQALNIATDADVPAGARLERDTDGRLTGGIAGPQGAIVALFERLPKPTDEEKTEGTLKFFRELNRLGMTGVVDPGGNNLLPRDYEPLFALWRRKALTVRVAYSLSAQVEGTEFDDFMRATAFLPMGFGDEFLRFTGIGERVTFGIYNNDRPSDAVKQQFQEIAAWTARRGMSLTIHWGNDASVAHILDIFDRVNRDTPIAPLRWSIAHLNDASPETLTRMKALGVGWAMQDAMYFGGDAFQRQRGPEAARRTPPVVTARRLGVVVGAGTDAHRVASYNPFTALQWLLDGRSVEGTPGRGPEEIPSRIEALRMYTSGSAWFAHDESIRGSLEVGKLADLAVLSHDLMTVPLEEIGGIESLLTIVGGRIVHAAGPFATVQ
jgi:predicted amidohydrolase YtcJ